MMKTTFASTSFASFASFTPFAGCVALVCALAAPLVSAQVLNLPYGAPVTLETAKKAAAAASAEAQKLGLGMVLAVTDPSGLVVYLEKADAAQNAGVKVAIAKSRSAALFKRATKVFEDQLATGGVNTRLLLLPDAMPLEGGVPLVVDGKIVGAIGASGGSPTQDGLVAKAGADAVSR